MNVELSRPELSTNWGELPPLFSTMQDSVADPSHSLPIDISFSKLTDWLVDRKKVPPDWRKKLASIHSRVASAVATLPRSVDPWFHTLTPDEARTGLSGNRGFLRSHRIKSSSKEELHESGTGYLEAKRIRDILLSALPESRNLFGRPAGKAGDWDAIVSAYEKDLIYLGEAAQIMVQNVTYEIPYIKKQIVKLQQQLIDSERKEAEVKRNAAQSAVKYQQACEELGICGVNIRAELLALGDGLPSIFADVVEALCTCMVGRALEYYVTFVGYAHGEQGVVQKDEIRLLLPTLTELRDNPPNVHAMVDLNPKVFACQGLSDGKKLESVSQPDMETTGEIDWGNHETGGDEASFPIDIDWDIGTLEFEVENQEVPQADGANSEEKGSNGKGPEISEQLTTEAVVEDMQPAPEICWDFEVSVGESTEINWDIDVEEHGPISSAEEESANEKNSPSEGVLVEMGAGAIGQMTCLVETDYRNRLLDDLFELKAFLKQRLEEIESEETSALQNQVQAVAPSALPQHGSESLQTMVSSVTQALNLLTNQKTRELILISISLRHLDRLERSLLQKKQNESKLQQSMQDLGSKRVESRNTLTMLWPKQEQLLDKTLSVKQLVEKTLSKQYDGRKVNVIGEINTLLGQVC